VPKGILSPTDFPGNILPGMPNANHKKNPESLIPEDAFERDAREGTLGAEEEMWLSDPDSAKLASGAQKILASESDEEFSGELID
jgi:glutamate---cysteine ligase / carboxylate-amine ligase